MEFVNFSPVSLWTHVQDLQILLNSFTYLISMSVCASFFFFYNIFPLIQICPLVLYQTGDYLPLQWVSHCGPCSGHDLSLLCFHSEGSLLHHIKFWFAPIPFRPLVVVPLSTSFCLVSSFSYHILFTLPAIPICPFFPSIVLCVHLFHCLHQFIGVVCSPPSKPALR